AYASHFSRRTANTAPDTITDEYELELGDGCRKSVLSRKNNKQTVTDNERQEDILGDSHPKNILVRDKVTAISEAEPVSQKGSFRSDRSDIPAVPCKELGENCTSVL